MIEGGDRGLEHLVGAHHAGQAVRTRRWISLPGGKELRVLSRKMI